ncbi:hypothetical protein BDZ89DRAFT_981793 [Hymenopellis radicata]|nr:hypothetical protein BDZ89DRAFT_981793 [Hymenopellis radicata]
MSRFMSPSPPAPAPLLAPRPYRTAQFPGFDAPPPFAEPSRPPRLGANSRLLSSSPEPEPHNDASPAILEDSESSDEEISEEASSQNASNKDEETATCLWGDCGKVFTQLASLIEHIHTEHVGVNKSNYYCDWSTCTRRGIPQTSRFALTSHLRSHTKEKPFVCPLPECDKSFTRSDALAKHLRHQHNKSPPAPGRGGSRKRKRLPGDIEVTAIPSTRSLTPTLSTFAFNVNPEGEVMDFNNAAAPRDPFIHVRAGSSTRSPSPLRRQPHEDDEGYNSSSSTPDVIPQHLLHMYDPVSGKIQGRSQHQVMYLLMKAKYRYAQEQHDLLLEELRIAKAQLQREKEAKEIAVDRVLLGLYGAKAEPLVAPIPSPQAPPVPPEPNGKAKTS